MSQGAIDWKQQVAMDTYSYLVLSQFGVVWDIQPNTAGMVRNQVKNCIYSLFH